MPARSLIILVLGIVIAVGTALSLKSRMQSTSSVPETQVLVAAADIPAGAFVRSDYHVALADWPEKNITDSMLTTATVKPADFEGAVARRMVKKGEPITSGSLVKSNEGGFMSAVLEPGKRAISVAVDETSGNAGFIFPGDKVDLILSHQVDAGGTPEHASETFIEDVRVLAIDQMLDNPDNVAVLAKTVTLEVSPKQAEEINVAKDLGKISLSLRSLATKPQVETAPAESAQPMSFDDVLQSESGDAPQTLPPQNITRDTDISKIITPRNGVGTRVRILRGGQAPEDVQFSPEGTTSTGGGGGTGAGVRSEPM